MPTLRPRPERLSIVRELSEEEAATEASCPGCNRPDIAERYMVQCDMCERWYHFSCAKVDEAIKDRSFSCCKCVAVLNQDAKTDSLRSSQSGRSSSSRLANIQLQMQRLAEEQTAQEKLMQETQEFARELREKSVQQEIEIRSNSMKERMERELEFIKKKYNLLQNELNEEDSGSVKSVASQRSASSSVRRWLESQMEAALTSSGQGNAPTSSTSRTGTIRKGTTAQKQASSAGIDQTLDSQLDIQGSQAQVGTSTRVTPVSVQAMQNPTFVSRGLFGVNTEQRSGSLHTTETTRNGTPVSQGPACNTAARPADCSQAQITAHPLNVISPPTSKQIEMARASPRISWDSGTRAKELEEKIRDLQHQLNHLRLQSSEQPQVDSRLLRNSQLNVRQSMETVEPSTIERCVTHTNRFASSTSRGGRLNPAIVSFPSNQTQPVDLELPEHHSTPNTVSVDSNISMHPITTGAMTFTNLFGCPPVSSSVRRPPVTFVSSCSNPIMSSQIPPCISQVPGPIPMGPNAQQLAARHVVPKDLPVFDGNPVDWPLRA
nr:uncharacterized protein LOC115256123 [Aedes albopictus]